MVYLQKTWPRERRRKNGPEFPKKKGKICAYGLRERERRS
jgi:hypothetical protein